MKALILLVVLFLPSCDRGIGGGGGLVGLVIGGVVAVLWAMIKGEDGPKGGA
jgi:hypothetical protein